MKTILVLIAIILVLPASSQKTVTDSLFTISDCDTCIEYLSSFSSWCLSSARVDHKKINSITLCSDSTMSIEGDTATVVIQTIEWINDMEEEIIAMQAVLDRINLTELAKIAGSQEFTKAVKAYQKFEKGKQDKLKKELKDLEADRK